MKHSRQKLLHDPENSADILSVFPRFLDIPGFIDQDFRSLFGDATSAKMLEKWTTNFQAKAGTVTCHQCCCWFTFCHLQKDQGKSQPDKHATVL
ncbi:unnamed protein product [Arctogadus glacialis]